MEEETNQPTKQSTNSSSGTTKKIAIVLVVIAVVVVGLILINSGSDEAATNTSTSDNSQIQQPAADNSNDNQNSTGEQPTGSQQAGPITSEQVALHNTASDCWTIIDGKVYDLTSYIPRHPGGDEILRACGADGSSLFNLRQTSEGESVGTGTSHSSVAESQLEQLLVGDLSN